MKTLLKKIAKNIRRDMKDNNILFLNACPYPVSWRTINSILDAAEKNKDFTFSIRTLSRLCDYFGINYEIKGRNIYLRYVNKDNNRRNSTRAER
jgi:hypothetical protein